MIDRLARRYGCTPAKILEQPWSTLLEWSLWAQLSDE
jgi:hypothetical protein